MERDDEEDYEQRYLHLSEFGRMYKLDAVLDRAGGAALRSALDALAKPLGIDDARTPKQRRADAMVELVHHAMDKGTLPRRNGVRPHISVNTTIEGLKGELGAAASELQSGLPVSRKTVQRWACDGALHRALKADSVVVDVGRVTRTVSPAQWRALKARYKSCCWHGCDLEQPPPHRLLVGGWPQQPAQPPAAVFPPSPTGARRGVAGGAHQRRLQVHPAGSAGDDQTPVGRESLGGLGSEPTQ